jgi:hypothetical protein
MKVLCPICNMQGILEIRGNSKRVLHYKGFLNNKRIYEKHLLGISPLGINSTETGNKSMGINKPIIDPVSANKAWVRSSVRLEHRTFNPGVAGSIPVGPAFWT